MTQDWRVGSAEFEALRAYGATGLTATQAERLAGLHAVADDCAAHAEGLTCCLDFVTGHAPVDTDLAAPSTEVTP